MLGGAGFTPTERVLTHRHSAHRCLIWEKEESFTLALFLHSSLGTQVWLLVETRNWATGLQIQSSLCPCLEMGKETEVLLVLRLPFVFSDFLSPIKNYSKACTLSHKLMLLFSEVLLFSSRSTVFNYYSMKILCVYPDCCYLQNIEADVHIAFKVPFQINHPQINR